MTNAELMEELRKCPASAKVDLAGDAIRVVNSGGTEILRMPLDQSAPAAVPESPASSPANAEGGQPQQTQQG